MGTTITLTTELFVGVVLTLLAVWTLGYCVGWAREQRRNNKWVGDTVINLEARQRAQDQELDETADLLRETIMRVRVIEEKVGIPAAPFSITPPNGNHNNESGYDNLGR